MHLHYLSRRNTATTRRSSIRAGSIFNNYLKTIILVVIGVIGVNKLDAQPCSATITTIVGTGTSGFLGDGGAATAARIQRVYGLCVDNAGNIYIPDYGNHRIRKVSTDGTISTIVGNGTAAFAGDGGAATAASLWGPRGVALDTSGNLYIADENNFRIRKVTPSGIISTVAGNGSYGFAGDGGQATAARLASPASIAIDRSGNMYIADMGNNRVRKVTTSGIISTIAGNGTSSPTGDGSQATAAAVPLPHGIKVDNDGNIYVTNHSTHRVRKISTTGIISTIAGTGTAGTTGDGGAATAARINAPYGLHLDNAGNIYIACMTGNNVRKIDASGNISTFAGSGSTGFFGDGGAATAASIYEPYAIANDPSGNIIIADSRNFRIRKVSLGPPTITLTGTANVCVGSFSTLTPSATGGTWSSSDTTKATVNSSGVVAGIASGTAIISYSRSYDCGTALATRIVTVNTASSTPTISGSTNVCIGSGRTLTGSPTGGTWSSSATAVATIHPTSGFLTPVSVGTTTISYSVSASCGNYVVTRTQTVNAAASAGTISGPSSVCLGSTITLTNSVGGGTWSSSNPDYASVDSSGVVTPIVSGAVISIIYSVPSACGTVTTNKIVTTNALPYPGEISGNDTFCVGSSSTLSIYGAVGGSWSSSNTSVASVGSTATYTASINGVSSGNATITYTSTNTCGSIYTVYPIRVDGVLSSGTISGPTSVAVDSTITLSNTSSSGQWFSSNMYVASIDSTGRLTGHTSGAVTVSYIASNSCGTYMSTYNVTVTATAGSTSSCSGIISTIAGSGVLGFSGDGGPATAASMYYIHGLTVDSVGNVYFADWLNHRIRKVSTSGIITTVAGNGTSSYSGDGGPATAAGISQVTGLKFDNFGNLIICDQGNSRIRKVSTTGIITTIAGTGVNGYNGDNIAATAARVSSPKNIAIDKDNNIYIADYSNYRVRKITTEGIITTVAGNGSTTFSGDYGPATAAGVYPYDVDVDDYGNIYVATYDHWRIRKIVPSGKIYTIAGGGSSLTHTEGGPATSAFINRALGVAVDKSGNVYCSSFGDHKVYRVSPLGTITTVAGTGTAGYTGDGVAGNTSGINYPRDVAVDRAGNLYIADDYNQRIRRVRTSGAPEVTGIVGPDTVCIGSTITLIDTTPGGTWISTDTTRATVSATGVVTGINSGNTIIRYYKSNSCGVGGQSVMLRVNGPAFAGNLYGTFSACVGGTTTLYSSIPGGRWSTAHPALISVDSVTGVATALAAGLPKIYYTVNGHCGAGTSVKEFTVNATPATDSISGVNTLCLGDTTTYHISTSGGSWISSNTSVATINSAGRLTAVGSGTATISYSITGSCGLSYITKTINVLPATTAGTITGPTTICISGSGYTLSSTISIGTWSSSNPSVVSIDSSGNLMPITVGTSIITYTRTGTCGTAATTTTINVLNSPSTDSISGPAAICIGDSVMFTSTTYSGSWSSSMPSVLSVNSGGIVRANTFGTATISYTRTNTCGTSVVTLVVAAQNTVYPGGITGPINICLGDTSRLYNLTSGGIWSTDNASIATVNTTGLVTAIGAGSTNINYSVTNACGTQVVSETIYVDTTLSTISLSGLNEVCVGSSLTISSSTTGGSWSSSNPSIATINSIGEVTSFMSGSVIISYTKSNSCGTVIGTKSITINGAPTGVSVSGTDSLCTYMGGYMFGTPTGGTWYSNNPSIAVVESTGLVGGVASGNTIISYGVSNDCGTTYATKPINIRYGAIPNEGTLLGNNTICIGTANQFKHIATTLEIAAPTPIARIIDYAEPAAWGDNYYSISNAQVVSATGTDSLGCSTFTSGYFAGKIAMLWRGACEFSLKAKQAQDAGAIACIIVNNSDEAPFHMGIGTYGADITIPVFMIGKSDGNLISSQLAALTDVRMNVRQDTTTTGPWHVTDTSIATISNTGIVNGLSVGTTTVDYTVSNSCGIWVATKTININPTLTAGTITGSSNLCSGSTITLSNTVSGGSWSSSNAAIATVDGTGEVSGITAGSVIITYIVSNECGTATTTKALTVNPAPSAGTITGASSVDIGSTISLANAVSGGSWSSSNTALATVSSAGVVTGIAAGSVTISYAVTNACGTAVATKIITINSGLSDIAGSLVVCVGSSSSLSNESTGGLWSTASGSIAAINAYTGVLTGVSAGTTTVTYTVAGASVYAVATVLPIPAITSTTSRLCANESTTLTADISGGYWSSSSTTVGSVSSTTGFFTGLTAGSTVVTYTTADGCFGTRNFIIDPLPTAIAGTMAICQGATTTLTSSPGGGTWSASNTRASVTSTGIVTGITAGTTDITYTSPAGCMVKRTLTISPTPATITGSNNICNGTATSLSTETTGGSWSSSNTAVASVDEDGLVTSLSVGTSRISYTLTGGCAATLVVTVRATPAAITGATTICEGNTTVLSSMTGGGTWASDNTTVATVGISGIATGISSGATTISYTLSNGCAATTTVSVVTTPSAIAGLSAICVGNTLSLSATPSGGSWSVNMTSIATIDASGIVTAIAAGNATITYTIGACRSTGVVTVNGNPSAISGTASVCEGATTTLTCTPAGGSWSSSNTAVATIGSSGIVSGIAAGTATVQYITAAGCATTRIITVTPAPAISGTLSVCTGGSTTTLSATPSGGAWASSNTTLATVSGGVVTGINAGTVNITYTVGGTCRSIVEVIVNPKPAAITGSASVCVGSSTTLASTTAGGTWTSSNDAIATVAGGTVTGMSSGVATITYTLAGGCFVTKPISVNAAPAISSASTTLCISTNLALTGTPTGGTWSSSNTAIGTVSSAGSFRGITAGAVNVTYTVGGCFNTIALTVSSGSGTLSGPTSVCTFGTATITPSVAGGTWASANTALATVGTNGVVSGIATGAVTISYSNGGCVTTRSINVIGGVSAVAGALNVCAAATTTLTGTPTGGTWASSNTAVGTVAYTTGVTRGISTGNTNITYTLTNGCNRVSQLTVNPTPDSITGSASVCLGFTSALANATAGGTWSSSNAAVAAVDASGLVTGVANGAATISYTLAGGCFRTRLVNVAASLPASPANANVCVGDTITLSDPATGGIWSSSNTARATINATTGVVTGIAGGALTITYTFGGGACTRTTTLNVNSSPANIVGTANACTGRSATLVATATGGAWTVNDPSIATINMASGLWTGVAPGTTTVTYTIVGCRRYQVVTVNESPAAITGATSVAVGASTTLASATAGGNWTSSNTSRATVAGATGVVTGIATGTSTISYTIPNGCFATRNISITSSRPLASSTDGTNSLRLFPNPTNGLLNVQASEPGMLTIYTLDGKAIGAYNVGAELLQISLPNTLAAGMYSAHFVGSNGYTEHVNIVIYP